MKKELFSINSMDVIFKKITVDKEGNKTIEEYPHPEMKVLNLSKNGYNEYILILSTYLESEVLDEIDCFEEVEIVTYGKKYENGEDFTTRKTIYNLQRNNKQIKSTIDDLYKTFYTYISSRY